MLTLGIDLSSMPPDTAACVIDWKLDSAEVKLLEVNIDDAALLHLATDCDAIGIDAPFGWPLAFVDFINNVGQGDPIPLLWEPYLRDSLQFRTTDHVVRERFRNEPVKITPLAVAANLIALPAMRCSGLLAGLSVTDRSGDGRVFEVYPAVALSVWGIPKAKDPDARRKFKDACTWLKFDGDADALFCINDHTFDATIASIVARAAALRLTTQPSVHELEHAKIEGWIHVPVLSSLQKLPMGR